MSTRAVRIAGRSVSVQETFLDRAIGIVDPVRAARRLRARAALAIAGNYFGGSRSRRSVKEWNPADGDPDSTISYELDVLRTRSRDLLRNSPLAVGAINTACTNIVGTGLKLNARLDRAVLTLTDEQADAWERTAETEWALFWESREADVARTLTGHALCELAFRQVLENGDVFINLPRITRGFTPYTLRLQLIEADRVSNTNNLGDTESLVMGVEKDVNGAPVAYHVCNQFPLYRVQSPRGRSWTRIAAYNASTGLPNVIHLFRPLRPGQTRGIPYLTPVIESLKLLDRYTDAELNAAVIASMLTVFIKTEAGDSEFDPTGLGAETGAAATDQDIKLAPGAIIDLLKGEDISIVNPTRPNAAFDPFVLSILRQIGVALEVPFEILIKHFTSSYSAARAALLEAWKFFSARRTWLAGAFMQPIYETFLYEAIARGRLAAPGWFTDPLIRRAYAGAEWIGPARGMIDEKKEIDAAAARIDNFLSTHASETALLGGDWERNLPQLRKEREQLADGGFTWPAVATTATTGHDAADNDVEDMSSTAVVPDSDQGEDNS
jgi:lambda family phage portal protein